MKPTLVIGLGNPLMGDEGVGWHVAEQLAVKPGLPESVEVICGGTDLLRYAEQMEGRSRVFIVDALQDDAEPGSVSVWEEADAGLDERQEHAHHLSVWQSMKLLRRIIPARFTLLGISISSAAIGIRMSPVLDGHMAAILDRVLEELVWNSSM